VNNCIWSKDLSNTTWGLFGGATKTSTSVTVGTGYNSGVQQYSTTVVPAGTIITAAMILSGTPGAQINLSIMDNGGAYPYSGITITLTATPTLYVHTRTVTQPQHIIRLYDQGTATTVVFGGAALFTGTYTADQILDAGGIPLTTAASASSTYGTNSWYFDGTNDYLSLDSVPFQMVDDHCVVLGAKTTSSGNLTLFEVGPGDGTSPRVCSIRVNNLALNILWHDGTVAASVYASNVIPDVPFVVSGRKTSAGVRIRQNGIPGASSSNALASTVSAVSLIGNRDASTSEWMKGQIYPVIAIKGTVSDVDLLTLEKFVGSLSGVTI
jgi:hypothetical protein